MKGTAFLLAALLWLAPGLAAAQSSPRLNIGFSQDGERAGIRLAPDGRTLHVTLHARPFEIHFPEFADRPAYRVTFWTDDTIFAVIPFHKQVDAEKAEFTYLNRYGTIADYDGGSATIFLNDQGHQFFDRTRLARSGSDYATPIKQVWWKGEDGLSVETTLEQWTKPIYAVAWFDANKDGIVDESEVDQFVLHFT